MKPAAVNDFLLYLQDLIEKNRDQYDTDAHNGAMHSPSYDRLQVLLDVQKKFVSELQK